MTRTERIYYLVLSLYYASWSFTAPIYSLFLLSRGLDLLQINLVFATYLITAFLFEVPTGAIADVFGRKVSFLLSCGIRALAFSYYFYADTFAEFLLAEFVDGIGTTLATGALDAWAVDGIRAEGDLRPKDKMFARSHLLARVPMIAAGLISGYVAEGGLEWPFALGAALFVLTAATGAWFMQDDRAAVAAARGGQPRSGILATMAQGWAEVRVDPTLRWLCLLTAVISFAALPTWHYWSPRMQDLSGSGTSLIGWVFAAINLSAMAGSLIAVRAQSWPRRWLLAVATMIRGVTLGFAATASSFAPALSGFLFFEFGFALSEPLFMSWTSERSSSARRATVLSLRSMAFTLGGSVGLVCLGFVARAHGISTAWLCSAAILVVAALSTLFARGDRAAGSQAGVGSAAGVS